MPPRAIKITSLPSRYEPLANAFGDKAKTTFVPSKPDLEVAKRLLASAESAQQGKMLFLSAESGTGKSTFVHSLEIFLVDKVSSVVRLPAQYELEVTAIPGYLASIPRGHKFTIVNFDGREAPFFNEPEYQTFLGALNGVLRNRPDLIIIWPVTDENFAQKLVKLLQGVGGTSAFGLQPLHKLAGLKRDSYALVLEKILQVANWRLEDAAITSTEVETLIASSERVGVFLDNLQQLIATRFDVGTLGVTFPTLAIVISSGDPKIRETTRSLRRADSYYIEASRLMMYTKKSNVAEWWANRATDLKSALPHVVALFNAQLISMSASAVVHATQQFAPADLQSLASGTRADRGNARRVIGASELVRFIQGEAVDNREYGSSVSNETYEAYGRIQSQSEPRHKAINTSILDLVLDAGVSLPNLGYESTLVSGLQTDATYTTSSGTIALEFHHKAAAESTNNKIAIYVLEKLKEYAINFGLAQR
jgi:hypothetical protein